jgi:lysophospholipase L1-like esterase
MLLLVACPLLIRNAAWDRWYLAAFAAALGLLWLVLSGREPFTRGHRYFGPLWVRLLLLLLLLGFAGEAWLRMGSSHRTIYYAREGDLLFAPLPNQFYVEKISQTPSWTDEFGMRRTPGTGAGSGRTRILCLGDSITYGYGLADNETYPARLKEEFERQAPGAWTVYNGGVNAYPLSFIHQRFLQLWRLGVRPEVAVIGYSMNEGWLGPLVDSDEDTKRAFEWRVWGKNRVRESALYNVVMEKWARLYYDRIRLKLVPGTHDVNLPMEQVSNAYERTLERLLSDLKSRGVRPVFLAFASLNGYTMKIDTKGPLQVRFITFAQKNGIPVLRSDEAIARAAGSADISRFFQDPAHMTADGARLLAGELAAFIRQTTPALPQP